MLHRSKSSDNCTAPTVCGIDPAEQLKRGRDIMESGNDGWRNAQERAPTGLEYGGFSLVFRAGVPYPHRLGDFQGLMYP